MNKAAGGHRTGHEDIQTRIAYTDELRMRRIHRNCPRSEAAGEPTLRKTMHVVAAQPSAAGL